MEFKLPQVNVFYNPKNIEASVLDERFHAKELDAKAVFKTEKMDRNMVRRVDFDDLGYTSRKTLHQSFIRWAKRGKYEYLCGLYYLLNAPDGRQQQRLIVMAAADYAHYLKLQNALYEFMAIYLLSGDVPIRSY